MNAVNWIISTFVSMMAILIARNPYVVGLANQRVEGQCASYSAKLESTPDLRNMVVCAPKRHQGFEITDVKNTNFQRSFYWCEMNIQETDTLTKRYRHFGHNATHWWVEKGCGGWFRVTECKPKPRGRPKPPSQQGDTSDKDDSSAEMTERRPSSSSSGLAIPQPRRETININNNRWSSGAFRGKPTGFAFDPDDEDADAGWPKRITPPSGRSNGVMNGVWSEGGDDSSEITGLGHSQYYGSSSSFVDDLYKGWPRLGYRYPTSPAMWDFLDDLTSVDVPAQLGFYNRHADSTFL